MSTPKFSLLLEESIYCASGTLPLLSADALAYGMRTLISDARASEALCNIEQVDSLSAIRSAFYRGNLNDAKSLLNEIASKSASAPELSSEISLENARAAAFEGRWDDCILACNQGLGSDPIPISRLTLYQVRALAFFESGSFSRARRDLISVNTLSSLFPFTQAVAYAEILSARLTAREQTALAGEIALSTFWLSRKKQGTLNLDLALFALRAAADIARLSSKPRRRTLTAIAALSDCIGNRLYNALALTEIYLESSPHERSHQERHIQGLSIEFMRVRSLLGEVLSNIQGRISTSAQFIGPESGRQAEAQSIETGSQAEVETADHILLLAEGLKLDLVSKKIVPMVFSARIGQALRVLGSGPLEREEFFSQIWKGTRYRADLHEPVISNLLYRLRKQYALEARSRDGLISLERTCVL